MGPAWPCHIRCSATRGSDQRLLETNHNLVQGTAPESSNSTPTQESVRQLHFCICAASDAMLQWQQGAPFREAGHGQVEQLCVNEGIVLVWRCLKSCEAEVHWHGKE